MLSWGLAMFEQDPNKAQEEPTTALEAKRSTPPLLEIKAADPELYRLVVEISAEKGVAVQATLIEVVKTITNSVGKASAGALIVDLENKVVGMTFKNAPNWVPIAGVCFTVLTMISLYPLVTGWVPAVQRNIFFNVWVAFCAAASSGFLGNSATASGTLPLPPQWGGSPVKFSVYSGMAVFVIVLLLMSLLNT